MVTFASAIFSVVMFASRIFDVLIELFDISSFTTKLVNNNPEASLCIIPDLPNFETVTSPVNIGVSFGAFKLMVFVIVVLKFASFPNATANSFNVSNAPGAALIKFVTALLTNCVVAICTVFVPFDAVGAVGIPRRSTLS